MESNAGVWTHIRVWWALKVGTFKLKLINVWCAQYGLTPVRIISKGAADYIVSGDGSLHKIGRRLEKA